MLNSNDIVTTARSWVGTPYLHQGRSRLGVDCGGLLVCVARELNLDIVEFSANYSMSPDPGFILNYIESNAYKISKTERQPGDIIHFSFAGEPRHVGIASDVGVIHSWAKPMKVVEHRIDSVWEKRIVNIYRYKGL